MERFCRFCNRPFRPTAAQVKRGDGFFCSKSCGVKGQPRRPLAERFWEKIDKNGPLWNGTPCWVWTGARNTFGYGQIQRGAGSGRVQAHILSWEIRTGHAPNNLCVLHHCDNPPCVNPAHLFLGTKKDNTADMTRKGRHKGRFARKT